MCTSERMVPSRGHRRLHPFAISSFARATSAYAGIFTGRGRAIQQRFRAHYAPLVRVRRPALRESRAVGV